MAAPTTKPLITLADLRPPLSRMPQVCVAVQTMLERASAMTQKITPQTRPDFPPTLRITSKVDFHRRGGRTWMRTPTVVSADEFTDQQLHELANDPELVIEEISA